MTKKFQRTVGKTSPSKHCKRHLESRDKYFMDRPRDSNNNYIFTEKEVETVWDMSKNMCTYEEIGAELGVDEETVRTKFSLLVTKGRQAGKLSLRRLQFKHAEKSFVMAIWLGKQYLDQSEPLPKLREQDASDLRKFLEIHDKAKIKEEIDGKTIELDFSDKRAK